MMVKLAVALWWRPRRIELHFHHQGIRGPRYHFIIGNIKEVVSTGLPQSPYRAYPTRSFLVSFLIMFTGKIYTVCNMIEVFVSGSGSTMLIWFGTMVRLMVSDPGLIGK
ncbi:hypothetical protein CRG98_049780 [Punica granatum]|uniref:Uncharacterized protein n=1 Tax=Punica granatum TaxID=22663 RepID=A0A2I0H1Y5_PUNGR|nr:hypothetical protein CRG98_049780 [Punica granatum]